MVQIFVIELIMKTHLLHGVLATEATGTVAGFLVYREYPGFGLQVSKPLLLWLCCLSHEYGAGETFRYLHIHANEFNEQNHLQKWILRQLSSQCIVPIQPDGLKLRTEATIPHTHICDCSLYIYTIFICCNEMLGSNSDGLYIYIKYLICVLYLMEYRVKGFCFMGPVTSAYTAI